MGILIKYFIVIFIGLLEAFGITINSKFRQKSNKLYSFITAFFNIFLWIYIVSQVVENINNIALVIVYALSYSIGDVLGLTFDKYLEKLAKLRGLKFKRKKYYRRKR
jgi:uncharacterized protein YebE (UPF0316 family)